MDFHQWHYWCRFQLTHWAGRSLLFDGRKQIFFYHKEATWGWNTRVAASASTWRELIRLSLYSCFPHFYVVHWHIIVKLLISPTGISLFYNVHGLTHDGRMECSDILKRGYLLGVLPGGVREALFSDENYSLLWGRRSGFAHVARDAKVVSSHMPCMYFFSHINTYAMYLYYAIWVAIVHFFFVSKQKSMYVWIRNKQFL